MYRGALFLLTITVLSCGGEDTPGERICATVCAAVERCGDEPGICDECPNNQVFQAATVAAAQAAEACALEAECPTLRAYSCIRERVPISAEAQAFCSSHAASLFECGSVLDFRRCEQEFSVSDRARAKLEACSDVSPCEDRISCMQQARI